MTKQITVNGKEIIAVSVSEDAYEFEVSQHPLTDTELIYQVPVHEKSEGKDIDGSVIFIEKYDYEAQYKILGTASADTIDFDCSELFGKKGLREQMKKQRDQLHVSPEFFRNKLISLLAANGIWFANPLGKSEPFVDFNELDTDFDEDRRDRWKEAESKVVKKIIVIQKL